MRYRPTFNPGFSLVEVIVVSALTALVFGALFASFQYSLALSRQTRIKLTALSVATERMEYFRSLPYNDVGTVAGIPSGVIPQNSTKTLNGVDFAERVLVEYVDDAADGLDVLDSNGIPSDYKRLKLEYTWVIKGETSSIFLVSNIVPRAIESTAGGGTVRINVIDENSTLLSGASVQLINTTGTPIDVTRYTDVSGSALFSGTPAASEYEIVVTGPIDGADYSTAKTYQVTVDNPTPVVAPFSVLESDISTLTFQIGELSDLEIKAFSELTDGMFREEFVVLSVASSSKVTVNGGELVLTDTLGVYDSDGFAYLGPITPVPLQGWQAVRVVTDNPSDTTHKAHFYTGAGSGPYTLISDFDLSGNTAGFTGKNFDISELDPVAYPSIFMGLELATTDSSKTPAIDEVSVFYRQTETELAGFGFDLVGAKIIGTDGGVPIPKFRDSYTADGDGQRSISDLEFDTYTVIPAVSYDMSIACTAHPILHQAGIDSSVSLVLVADAVDTLRVSVVDSGGVVIQGAAVNLSRSGYDVTTMTNNCGQSFFTGGLGAYSDYDVSVTATGYITESISTFSIADETVTTITLTE